MHSSRRPESVVRPEVDPAAIERERIARDVTVVIPAFRNGAYLPAAIASALAAPAGSVLVADDACGPAERHVLERFEAAGDSRFRVLRSDTRRGIAGNLNAAVARVRTPYFVRLDGDDVLLPGHVEAAWRLLAARPALAAVAGSAIRIGPDDCVDFRRGALPPYPPDPAPRILAGLEAFRFTLRWDPYPSSSGTVYRVAAFHDVGDFNVAVPWGEDWEIWFRFARAWQLAYLDAPAAFYRIHGGATTQIYARQNRLCRDYAWMYRRAAELCSDSAFRPDLRRAFRRSSRLYLAAAIREARQYRLDALTYLFEAVRSLVTSLR